MRYTNKEKSESRQVLLELLKPGDTVYTVLKHVSRSGMMRHIQLKIARDGDICDITYHAARVLGGSIAKDGGIRVAGCGMDMGFALIYNLGAVLWPNGTPEPHSTRNGEPDNDGGYALKQRWI